KSAGRVLEALPRYVDRAQTVPLGELAGRGGRAVEELGANLDRHARLGRGGCFYAAADAIARFEHENIEAVLDENVGGREARGAGADDDDVCIATASRWSRHSAEPARLRRAGRFCGRRRDDQWC